MTETPFATEVSIGPGVQFKTVEGHTLLAHAFFMQVGTDFAVEAVLVHAEVGRGVPQADDPRHDSRESSCLSFHSGDSGHESSQPWRRHLRSRGRRANGGEEYRTVAFTIGRVPWLGTY
jgi:hypothetical protein